MNLLTHTLDSEQLFVWHFACSPSFPPFPLRLTSAAVRADVTASWWMGDDASRADYQVWRRGAKMQKHPEASDLQRGASLSCQVSILGSVAKIVLKCENRCIARWEMKLLGFFRFESREGFKNGSSWWQHPWQFPFPPQFQKIFGKLHTAAIWADTKFNKARLNFWLLKLCTVCNMLMDEINCVKPKGKLWWFFHIASIQL